MWDDANTSTKVRIIFDLREKQRVNKQVFLRIVALE
jgi:hypothetical protein